MKIATSIWGDALMRLLCMRESKAWTKLMEMNGETSIDRFAALQCSLGLKITQAEIVWWSDGTRSVTMAPRGRLGRWSMPEAGLDVVRMCCQQGYSKDGYTWSFPNVLTAKYVYRTAFCIRLWERISDALLTLEPINQARMLAPDDAVIPKEQHNHQEVGRHGLITSWHIYIYIYIFGEA